MTLDSSNFDKTKSLNSMLSLFSTGHYGIEHAYRVFKLVERIAEFEKLEGDQVQIIKFCALFIDMGREENQKNSNFGLKSYEKLRKANFFGKNLFKNNLTHFLFQSQLNSPEDVYENMAQFKLENREEALLLYKLLKDALTLEAFRFGNFCGADLDVSNSKKMVLFASQFQRKELNVDLIVEEIENWLKEIQ
ncbi:HD domain-containing protein [Ancylomarina sp. 16SWW S1-10-2]|uniref:HD domain-containing protein n=1 Tax=Ancylomarina sp. 16SWW S1-10-2 TaxID=2499681 RepID=UPI0012ADDA10|nr:HD domain-containing protein [Ancylomarina sp. 16SWW S1-10-2]MRT93827.1 hypothetical protein [Ancylomarina sp. 16SWW S1-10-2]